jgi:hypothetical protein
MAKLETKSVGKMEEEWQTESDIRTLLEARKIKKDPKRMKCVRDMAKSKLGDMASLADTTDSD